MSARAISVVAFLLLFALLAFIPAVLFPERWVAQVYVAVGVLGLAYLLLRRRGRPRQG